MEDRAHPEPTPATVKVLYGRALRCARPDCPRPLYKQDNDTGELVLNSRVAHIRARRPGGPRWKQMDAEDNRGPANLLLLCIEHSYEVDDRPDAHPADLLREWKQAQLDEYERVQRGWAISDTDAGRVLEASSSADRAHAGAVVGVVRAAERLALTARRSRQGPAARAAAWRGARERARSHASGWDQDGNAVHAEPSRAETEQLEAALVGALADAVRALVPPADEAKVELAAARASRPSVSPWSEWVGRCVDAVLGAASTWPAAPDLHDDDRLDAALRALADSVDALASAWRGEPAADPPAPPPVAPERSEAAADPLQAHKDLLDRARPYSRVSHRPYDPGLRTLLAYAAQDAASLPTVLATLGFDLQTTCRLAAAVAGNADPEQLALTVEQDKYRRPLCAATTLIEATRELADRRGLPALAEQARAAIEVLFETTDWSDPSAWEGNDSNGAAVFWTASRALSPERVRERLAQALHDQPGVVLPLVTACAGWIEHHDNHDWRTVGLSRGYNSLAPWFPAGAVVAAAALAAPGVAPATGRPDGPGDGSNPEALVAQVLRLAAAAAP